MKKKNNQKPTVLGFMSNEQLKNHKFPKAKDNAEPKPMLSNKVTLNPDGTVLTLEHLTGDWDMDKSTD